jgi:hypothetical protein
MLLHCRNTVVTLLSHCSLVLDLLDAGGHVVVQKGIYGGTYRLFERVRARTSGRYYLIYPYLLCNIITVSYLQYSFTGAHTARFVQCDSALFSLNLNLLTSCGIEMSQKQILALHQASRSPTATSVSPEHW